MTTAFLFAALFLFLFMGMPIAFALGLSSVLVVVFFSSDSLGSVALKLFSTADQFTLLSIPFFILSGVFLSTGGVAKRLIDFTNACVGHLHGGLAIASVFACMLFAAVSGSSPATVVAVGGIVIGGMVRHGYTKSFAAGVISNAGTLGILIPPSIVMVVYAAATQVSVGRLFMAGFLPGLLLGLMLMVAIYVAAKRKNIPRRPRAPFSEVLRTGGQAIWGLLLIVIIMGGIYMGWFTPTEAAAVAVIYAAFVALVIYRDMGVRDIPKVMTDAGKVTIMLMFIIANATLFAHVLTSERIPQIISEAILANNLQPWMFLLVVNIILLIAGDFMEPSSIILIMSPIVFPIAMKLGIDPIHLGIIFVVNMEIGMVTPPVGLNLFVTSGITNENLFWVFRAAFPWMMVMLLFLAIITYVPIISTFLPNLVFGPEIVTLKK
jgi:C4-dicarboxylate transporter DctM subunit